VTKILDVRNIFAGSHTERWLRCSEEFGVIWKSSETTAKELMNNSKSSFLWSDVIRLDVQGPSIKFLRSLLLKSNSLIWLGYVVFQLLIFWLQSKKFSVVLCSLKP
jgi:hypothetical protein